jgi:hypothetical protein
MKTTLSMIGPGAPLDTDLIASLIVQTQRPNGEIPWWSGGKTDPWDHVEAAMGLSVGGYFDQAKRAFDWMADTQLEDGSFHAAYHNGVPKDLTRDTNMSAYIAMGVFHHYLITGETDFLEKMWPTVRKAIDFAVSHQAPGGEIFWAVDPGGKIDPMALLTGSSSIYMSIKCALAIADRLGSPMTDWRIALKKLGNAIRQKPGNFNTTKSRYSMDWFYPVLCGAITGEKAQQRIDRFWKKFVIKNQGARCVSDRPWVTVAETCELSVALSAMGRLDLAEPVFNWIQDKANPDGSYWCGFTCPDMTIWPDEKTTWTNAVVLIAADAIYGLTPAGRLFSHRSWANDRWRGSAAV